MSKSFLQRRLEAQPPDYDITVWIRGHRDGDTGFAWYNVYVEGEDDFDFAAGILERAAEVLRDGTIKGETS